MMKINYYKQNSVKTASSIIIASNQVIKIIVGKQMKKTQFVQIAIFNGLNGSQIAIGFMTINQFFNIAHMPYVKTTFNKKYFKA